MSVFIMVEIDGCSELVPLDENTSPRAFSFKRDTPGWWTYVATTIAT